MDVFKRTESSITKRFLAIAIVALCCIPWTPCSSRPIFSPEESAGGTTRDEEGKSHNDNASMVVRIIVSSSSSSSSSSSHHDDSDFSHLLIDEENSNNTNKSARSIEDALITPLSPQQWSSRNQKRLIIEPSTTSTTTVSSSTIAPPFLITTYRPKLSFQVPIYTFSRPAATTTTTTIKPLPFEENIFSVFYRAFSHNHYPASSLGIARTFQSNPRPKQPEVVTNGSKNVETFQVFPNPRSAAAQFRNPYRRHDSSKQQINKMDATTDTGHEEFESLKDKTVTSVVTRSSSSISTKFPTISAHYPRIRPSSVMMLSLKGVEKEVTPESTAKPESIASNPAKMADNESDWSMKEILVSSKPEPLTIPEAKSDSAVRQQESFPRAEALIQDRPEVNDVTKSGPNGKQNDSALGPTVPLEIIPETKEPESNWSQPAKVWGEPAKVWGEPAKVWSQPAKVWSEPATTYRSIEPELELVTETNSTEDIEASDDDSPQGTFYEIGEDEEEIPTGVPAELTRKSDHPHLPELTSQLDHSFLDPSSRSVEVAESIQVSLKHHHTANYRNNNKHRPDSSKLSQMSSSSSQEENTRNLQEQREKSAKKFGYILDGSDVRKYRVEERTPDGYIVGEYGILSDQHGFVRGVRYTADGTINPRLIHEALMKFLSL